MLEKTLNVPRKFHRFAKFASKFGRSKMFMTLRKNLIDSLKGYSNPTFTHRLPKVS
jgi:hypothetical protein